MDELDARARIQEALKEANDPSNPITDLLGFLILVRDKYLAPAVYRKYEKSVIFEMWSRQQDARPPSPAASTSRDSPDSKAVDAPGDNLEDLPSLEAEAQICSVWIVQPTRAEFKHAKYKQWSHHGSYIRADTVQSNNLRVGKDGFVVIQWDLEGPSGTSNNFDDNAAVHTVCRVVSKDEAKRIGMDVDVVFGTDWRDNLENQAFGVHVVPRACRRLDGITEQEPPTSTLLASSSLSQQQPSIARLEAPLQHVINNFYGTTIICGAADLTTAFSMVPTHRAATGLSGNAIPSPGVAEMDIPKIPEGSRNKRKMADEHEPRSRDRAERFQG